MFPNDRAAARAFAFNLQKRRHGSRLPLALEAARMRITGLHPAPNLRALRVLPMWLRSYNRSSLAPRHSARRLAGPILPTRRCRSHRCRGTAARPEQLCQQPPIFSQPPYRQSRHLGGIIPTPQLNRLAIPGQPFEGPRLFLRERPALEIETLYRSRRELPAVLRIQAAQISLRRHMIPHRFGHDRAETHEEPLVAKLLVSRIEAFSGHSLPEVMQQMSHVVKQRRCDH